MKQQNLDLKIDVPLNALSLDVREYDLLLYGIGYKIDQYKLSNEDKAVIKKILTAFPELCEIHNYLLKD